MIFQIQMDLKGVKHRWGPRVRVLHFLQLPESFRYLHSAAGLGEQGWREGSCLLWCGIYRKTKLKASSLNITGQSKLPGLGTISSVMKQEMQNGNHILISKMYARRFEASLFSVSQTPSWRVMWWGGSFSVPSFACKCTVLMNQI